MSPLIRKSGTSSRRNEEESGWIFGVGRMLDFKKREPARLSGGQKQRWPLQELLPWGQLFWFWPRHVGSWGTQRADSDKRSRKTIRWQRSITHDLEEVAMSDCVLVMKRPSGVNRSPRELFSRDDLDQIGWWSLYESIERIFERDRLIVAGWLFDRKES